MRDHKRVLKYHIIKYVSKKKAAQLYYIRNVFSTYDLFQQSNKISILKKTIKISFTEMEIHMLHPVKHVLIYPLVQLANISASCLPATHRNVQLKTSLCSIKHRT